MNRTGKEQRMGTSELLTRFRAAERGKTYQGDGSVDYFRSGGFRLRKDDYGWYVITCRENGEELILAEQQFQGSMRKAVSLFSKAQHAISWDIAWGKEPSRVYAADNPTLLESILSCPGFLSLEKDAETVVPLYFDSRKAALKLKAVHSNSEGEPLEEGSDSLISFQVLLSTPAGNQPDTEEFDLLTPELAAAGKRICTIDPVTDADTLQLFNTELYQSDAVKVMSLFATLYRGSAVEYLDYDCRIQPESIDLKPALIFEGVDSTGAMIMNIGVAGDRIDPEVINEYEVTSAAIIDDEERTVEIYDLQEVSRGFAVQQVEKLLKKRQNKSSEAGTFTREDTLFFIQPELAMNFLEHDLSLLIADFTLIGAKKLESFKIRTASVKLRMQVSSGIDFLEGQVDVLIDEETLPLSVFLARTESERYILLSDGTKAVIDHKLIERLKRVLKTDKKGNTRISFFDLPVIQDMIDEKTAGKGFLKSRSVLEGFNHLEDAQNTLPSIHGTLRDYQKKGAAWLSYLKKYRLGGCLADDMGLGKTIQTITLLASLYLENPASGRGEERATLIIMPNSLLLNWKREVGRFAPWMRSSIYHGPKRDLEESLAADLVLTTYATVRNDIKALCEYEFACIVLDESQRIKNIESQISRAVMLLKGEYRLALSGTPIENDLSELYALFRFLNPAMFGSRTEFQHKYYNPITKQGDQALIGELKRKIYPFLLRRLKSEVLEELPEKSEQIVTIDMSPRQKDFYEQRRLFHRAAVKQSMAREGFAKSRFLLLAGINELRQIASVPEMRSGGKVRGTKLELLCEYLEETVGNEHKALVFANFLGALERIGEELDRRGITWLKMTGATKDRAAVTDAFQQGEEVQVLLMTLKTGGVGLNLTAADYVYIFDPWWNAAAELQAVDRVHRIGQKNSVFSYKLITRGTIEEKILQLQHSKQELAAALVESDQNTGNMKHLKEEDIDFLFSGGMSDEQDGKRGAHG